MVAGARRHAWKAWKAAARANGTGLACGLGEMFVRRDGVGDVERAPV